MPRKQRRTLFIAIAVVAIAWALSWGGYVLARKSKMTAARVTEFVSSMHLENLSPAERAKKLREFIDKLNALSPSERQKWNFDRDLFKQLTEEEKLWFVDAVLPAEMAIVLDQFEKMPKEKRQEEIDRALKDLREKTRNPNRAVDPNAPVLSPELDKKVRTMGLKAVFSESSAQTKADLMPLLLEVQRQFEQGKGLNDFR